MMLGGVGNDRYIVDDARDVVVEHDGAGSDTIVVLKSSLPRFSLADHRHVENLVGLGEADFAAVGNDHANIIYSHAGRSTLSGGGGDDILISGIGDDHLDGNRGADTMSGGSGADTYVVDDSDDHVIEAAGGGVDTVETTLSKSGSTSMSRT